jgi:hypothetical protein
VNHIGTVMEAIATWVSSSVLDLRQELAMGAEQTLRSALVGGRFIFAPFRQQLMTSLHINRAHFKPGAPYRGEEVAKYNRLTDPESELKGDESWS